MYKLEKRVFVFLRDSKYSSFPFDFYSNLLNNYNAISEKALKIAKTSQDIFSILSSFYFSMRGKFWYCYRNLYYSTKFIASC